ncbi:hypothetical protein [Candidatus Amarobacter glycogenicus]|uniref:hypothetical protein n=1 Tax=Candidatus Amarobacter glycogenicus TaxID=3140699 RepID=UPI002A0DCF3D|nr:hypothetical protein [Dehalococcoidia bacterium]
MVFADVAPGEDAILDVVQFGRHGSNARDHRIDRPIGYLVEQPRDPRPHRDPLLDGAVERLYRGRGFGPVVVGDEEIATDEDIELLNQRAVRAITHIGQYGEEIAVEVFQLGRVDVRREAVVDGQVVQGEAPGEVAEGLFVRAVQVEPERRPRVFAFVPTPFGE